MIKSVNCGQNKRLRDELKILLSMYGSEVWGIYDKDDFNNWEKDDIEKTHTYFCKQSLGVNKQCPDVATRNELGRLPLKLAIETSVLRAHVHKNQTISKIFGKCRKMDFAYILTTGRSL